MTRPGVSGKTIRVLIIDDSALIRKVLTDILSADPAIEVVGAAGDPLKGRDMIVALAPDVVTLDIEMPRLDGLSFLSRLMRLRPLPVVMISALTQEGAESTLKALELGAVDFIGKPLIDIADGFAAMADTVRTKIRQAALASVQARSEPSTPAPPTVWKGSRTLVAIGASTGGVAALCQIIPALPADAPAIVITQHMPPVFTRQFAQRLDAQSAIAVTEAADGQIILPGHAYVAPGDRHLEVYRSGGVFECRLHAGPLVNGCRPSVDVLFASAAEAAGRSALGLLLTGMGRDGAAGLLRMREAGAATVCQDEPSSVIYGMPQVAKGLGAAMLEAPLSAMAGLIMSAAGNPEALQRAMAGCGARPCAPADSAH